MHWKASRLLAQLPDDSLAPDVEIEVRAHVVSCARCRSRLHEIQLSEDLLRRIPPSIVPIEPSRGAYVRLAALASWTDDEEIAVDPQGWRISLVSVTSALLLFCVSPALADHEHELEILPPCNPLMPGFEGLAYMGPPASRRHWPGATCG